MNDNGDSLYTPQEVARLLQVHVMTVYGWIRRGRLGAIRCGRVYRVQPHDLNCFLEANRLRSEGVAAFRPPDEVKP